MAAVLVKHVMVTKVVTLFEEQTLALAEDVMRFKKVRHVPVIDELRRLVGLVTHRDLVRAQISPLTGLSDDDRRARHEEIRLREVMTRDVWTVRADTLASIAGTTMLDHGHGCLPVVDGTHRLIGIVTAHDLLRVAVKTLRMHETRTDYLLAG